VPGGLQGHDETAQLLLRELGQDGKTETERQREAETETERETERQREGVQKCLTVFKDMMKQLNCSFENSAKMARETETERDRERQRDRETERQRDRETERQRDRETERETERGRAEVPDGLQGHDETAQLFL
jgi:hypothetical protein